MTKFPSAPAVFDVQSKTEWLRQFSLWRLRIEEWSAENGLGGTAGESSSSASSASGGGFAVYGTVAAPVNTATAIAEGNAFVLAAAQASASTVISLPAATGALTQVIVKRLDANLAQAVTISPNGTDTIEGVNAAQSISNQMETLVLRDIGAGTWVIEL